MTDPDRIAFDPPSDAPTAAAGDTQTWLAAETGVLRPAARSLADPPPPVVLCWRCWAIADRPDPPGWVVCRPAPGAEPAYRFGACPACIAADYTIPVTDRPAG